MSDLVIVEDPTGARATISFDALAAHEARGFTAIGPANGPGDTRTPTEAAKETSDAIAAEKARRAAIFTPAAPAKKEK